MAHLLSIEDLRVVVGSRTLLDGVRLGIGDGTRVGVLGPNGAGKSTLLAAMAGTREPDGGRIVREISAEELSAACRKCLRVEVSDTSLLARALDGMHLEYKVLSDTTADVFAKPSISELNRALEAQGCELISMQEKSESLESYYVNLVGGASHG